MSNRYAPLPNNPTVDQAADDELEAAFDDSEDEDASESQPLNPNRRPAVQPTIPQPTPGAYNFDADYDYPPPGSPPRPSAIALPNDHGNSNGITSFTVDTAAHARRGGWFSRTAATVLPTHYVQRFGLGRQVPSGVVGGGTNMDGVFANVTAKPSRPVRVQTGEDTYMVPEDTRPEAPPSYAAAQADSVPPYWETTVHTSLSPDAFGEVMIDSLPTGSLFAFLWNMLVSISFQFIGFLLTYMLHTSHAARLGSRAGLGVTFIQFGLSMRPTEDGTLSGTDVMEGWWKNGDGSSGSMLGSVNNGTWSTLEDTDGSVTVIKTVSSMNEWISFFLMTVGWFILLTSLLGFWRVKRWEHGILRPQRPADPRMAGEVPRERAFWGLQSAFGISALSGPDVRAGLGFGGRSGRDAEGEIVVHESAAAGRTEGAPDGQDIEEDEGAAIARRRQEARESDRRLRDGLHAAGLL